MGSAESGWIKIEDEGSKSYTDAMDTPAGAVLRSSGWNHAAGEWTPYAMVLLPGVTVAELKREASDG